MYGPPHQCGVESAAPRCFSIYDGLTLTEACQVLASDVDGEMSEPTGDLRIQLLVGVERRVAVGCQPAVIHGLEMVGHSPASV